MAPAPDRRARSRNRASCRRKSLRSSQLRPLTVASASYEVRVPVELVQPDARVAEEPRPRGQADRVADRALVLGRQSHDVAGLPRRLQALRDLAVDRDMLVAREVLRVREPAGHVELVVRRRDVRGLDEGGIAREGTDERGDALVVSRWADMPGDRRERVHLEHVGQQARAHPAVRHRVRLALGDARVARSRSRAGPRSSRGARPRAQPGPRSPVRPRPQAHSRERPRAPATLPRRARSAVSRARPWCHVDLRPGLRVPRRPRSGATSIVARAPSPAIRIRCASACGDLPGEPR